MLASLVLSLGSGTTLEGGRERKVEQGIPQFLQSAFQQPYEHASWLDRLGGLQ